MQQCGAAVDNCTLALACSDLRKVHVVATISLVLRTFTVALAFVAAFLSVAEAFPIFHPHFVMQQPFAAHTDITLPQ